MRNKSLYELPIRKLPLHNVWKLMIRRCKLSNHDSLNMSYFFRGIRVCEEWQKFGPFYEWAMKIGGYRKGLQLDRIDNNKGYSPDNCRFVTAAENCRNKTNTIFWEYNGQRKTIFEWAEITGVHYKALVGRHIRNNWTLERTLNTPLRKRLKNGSKCVGIL